jgi:hypothetical protein
MKEELLMKNLLRLSPYGRRRSRMKIKRNKNNRER